jgi:hypothetical protein
VMVTLIVAQLVGKWLGPARPGVTMTAWPSMTRSRVPDVGKGVLPDEQVWQESPAWR